LTASTRSHPLAILAYGSLVRDPGDELARLIDTTLEVETPFTVEYGRFSRSRGGGPTVVPHPRGGRVAAHLLHLRSDVTVGDAIDALWRRECRIGDRALKYVAASGPDAVVVRQLHDALGCERVLFTDFNDDGKLVEPSAEALADAAIRSVRGAPMGRDGISYLDDLISLGIVTPLTHAYRAEILRVTGAATLDEARQRAGTRA
jgi:hypothetical protein